VRPTTRPLAQLHVYSSPVVKYNDALFIPTQQLILFSFEEWFLYDCLLLYVLLKYGFLKTTVNISPVDHVLIDLYRIWLV